MMKAASRSATPVNMPSGMTSSTNNPATIIAAASQCGLNASEACFYRAAEVEDLVEGARRKEQHDETISNDQDENVGSGHGIAIRLAATAWLGRFWVRSSLPGDSVMSQFEFRIRAGSDRWPDSRNGQDSGRTRAAREGSVSARRDHSSIDLRQPAQSSLGVPRGSRRVVPPLTER
jgi:hypothetical protein